jgi:hypothetical protein
MKNRASRIVVALMATAGIVLTVCGQDDQDQSSFPVITRQPTDDAIGVGASTTFSVQATNGNAYQWYRNGHALEGKTNNALVLENVGTNDVGYYACQISKSDGNAVPTRSANLNVFTADIGGGPITIFGTPILSGGGSPNSCPGVYAGYVTYLKTASQGWGWAPASGTSIHTATDTNRSDTKIYYLGRYSDNNCAPTTIAVPDPAPSPKYRFTVFFPNNVPTNAYPIVLSGFDP